MEQLVVTIRDGKVVVEVEGVKGNQCLELTQAIEKLIGEVDNRLIKKDLYDYIKTKQTIFLKQTPNKNS